MTEAKTAAWRFGESLSTGNTTLVAEVPTPDARREDIPVPRDQRARA
jgi:hypothetical protein